ncbi:MAG: hypothetical protein IJQ31_00185, partial [Thermoguttaceae bacterium]|nr:hypothetical protein [Thermoguttaceae bacterium]
MTKSWKNRFSQSFQQNINHKSRELRMESLEERQLLSASPVSAASDVVDYTCIAPAEMTPMESAPVVTMDFTNEVPTLDAPVALGATGDMVDFNGYVFTCESDSTTIITDADTGIVTIEGSVSVTVGATPGNVTITGSGSVAINAASGNDTIEVGQSIRFGSGSITFDSSSNLNVTINGGAGDDSFNVAAAPTSGTLTLNGGAGTDILYNNTNVTLTSGGIEITSSTSGTVIVVTAASETADTADTISLSEAFAALNAGTLAGDYTLGFANANYSLDRALTSNYTNTSHKLTIDGTQIYDSSATGTVTVTVGNFSNTAANMTFGAGTTVVIDGLVYTGEDSMSRNKGAGISNSGTLTLTDGATVSSFNANGIENTSAGTLNLINGQLIKNTGDGIYNQGGKVVIGTEGSEAVDAVLISENKKGGIDTFGATAELTIYNGTIESNLSDDLQEQDYGINNHSGGKATLAGKTAASILIYDNGTHATPTQELSFENKGGVRNDIGCTLLVTGATIKINHGDGIFNEGTAIIGKADGTGKASDILILNNKSDGIENKGINDENSNAVLYIYNATITGVFEDSDNGEYGLYNHSGADAYLYGHMETVINGDGEEEEVPSIIINKHRTGGNVNGIIGAGGVIGDDVADQGHHSKVIITCVKISENYRDGIKNAGTMVIGTTDASCTADHIQITSNHGDSVENDGKLTIYKGTFSNNADEATVTWRTTNGIRNYRFGEVIIGRADGTGSPGDILIFGNEENGIRNENGSVTIYNATIEDNEQDGIENWSTMVIGAQNSGKAGDVLIRNNTANGIENTQHVIQIGGTNTGNLTVYNATIEDNKEDGIYNNKEAVTLLEGNTTVEGGVTTHELDISGNRYGVENYGSGSELEIVKGYIHGNTVAGVRNATSAVTTIGTQKTDSSTGGVAGDVLIVNNLRESDPPNNDTHGIAIQGGNVTIYNATIAGNSGDGIYNCINNSTVSTLNIDGNSKDAIIIGAAGEGSTGYNGNGLCGIRNGKQGNVNIYKATITGNGSGNENNNTAGITNNGGTVIMAASSSKEVQVDITKNRTGIRNNSGLLKVQGTGTGENSSIRIMENRKDGIYNAANLSAEGYELKNVYIYKNGSDGIENNGANAKINIVSATICNSTYAGLYNHGGAEAVLKGESAAAIDIHDNQHGVINEDASSICTINTAKIYLNTMHGVKNNKKGVLQIGTPVDGEATDVVIEKNKQNGIYNTGTDADLTIYNATITLNQQFGISQDKASTIKVVGNNTEDVYIYKNGWSGINSQGGGTIIVEKGTIDGNGTILGASDGGDGINNRQGTLIIGTYDPQTGEVGDAGDVVITNNTRYGIQNGENKNGTITAGTLTIYNATIGKKGEDGSTKDDGNLNGGIYNYKGKVTIGTANGDSSDVLIAYNLAYNNEASQKDKGNGIYNADELEIYNATIDHNEVDGIYNNGTPTLLGTGSGEDATIQILSNGQHGIYNSTTGTVEAEGVYIKGNGLRGIKNENSFTQTGAIDVVDNIGGGIDNTATGTYTQNAGTTLNVKDNKGAKDTSDEYIGVKDNGAGILNSGTLTLNGTTNITGNVTADNYNGGGIYQAGTLTNGLNGTLLVKENIATNGGGVYVAADTELNNGSTESITGNTATANGGGIYVASGKTLSTPDSATGNVKSNNAVNGAGIYNAGTLDFDGAVAIDGNTASGNGGGIYQGGTVENGLNGSLTIQDNEAVNGGGVYAAADTELNNGSTESITGNTATANGGGIYVADGVTLSVPSEATGNVKASNAEKGNKAV